MATSVKVGRANRRPGAPSAPVVEVVRGKEAHFRAAYPALGVEAEARGAVRASLYAYGKALWRLTADVIGVVQRGAKPLPESRAVAMRPMDLSVEEADEIRQRIDAPQSLPRRAPRDLPAGDAT